MSVFVLCSSPQCVSGSASSSKTSKCVGTSERITTELAKSGHSHMHRINSILTLYTKEGVESLWFLLYNIGSKGVCNQQSLADFQYSQTVKSHFAVWSSGQAVKVMVKIFCPQS